jgi:type III restriction enzyme
MSDNFLFEELNTIAKYGQITDKKYLFVNDNLNPKLQLRDYQKQAFNRFWFYYEDDKKPDSNIHLAFHMATGSGKTVMMAGLILYLYEKGYRNFLFFVNRGQIVEKTKDNFINAQSSKYLFNDKIIINNQQINIKTVDNFAYSSHDDINICFTTIQGLFSNFHNEKENSLTIEDFKENKIALIADEAHHINASTKKQIELFDKNGNPKASWENTVEKIFKANSDNILLEFSATIELDKKEIKKKYLDKIIYQYDLKNFVKDGFSKKINLFKSDTDKPTRILQALLISMYREQVAINNKLNIKPVILFKSSKIVESKDNQALFHTLIDNLKVSDLETIKKQTDIDMLSKTFDFFDKNNIGLNLLIEKIKIAFDTKKCLCTNSDKELELNQKRLNNLEDKDNSIRAIFTVDKLNEGWDVLNLFDIVRLYEGQNTGGSNKGKIGKKTVSEAQLIGRGARYCAFKINTDDNPYTRKFDKDINNELRILEELYFHSSNESQYISEITKVLIKQGLMGEYGEKPKELILKLKPEIKNKLIFKNKRIVKQYNYVKNMADFGIAKTNFTYELASGKGSLNEIFNDDIKPVNKKNKTYKLTELLGANIIKNALLEFDTFVFNNLQKYFPNLNSISHFLDDDYLGKFEIDIKGDISDLTTKQKLNIAISFLNTLENEIKNNIVEFEGTKYFEPHSAEKIFKEKTLLIPQDKKEQIKDITHDWFAFDKFYGTSEEEKLIELIGTIIDDINNNYENVYLIRNERHFALYDFAQGRRFEPDFILLSQDKNNSQHHYQFFIEPKGKHLQKVDKWKEDFLLAIEQNYKALTGIGSATTYSNNEYKIIGLEFYNHDDNNSFKSQFKSKLAI